MKVKRSSLYSPRRRDLLRLTPLLVLGGCDALPEGRTESFLRTFQKFNDWVQARVFDPTKLVREYADHELTPEEGFRINGKDDEYPDVDPAAWRLQVDGLVAAPGEYPLETITKLPKYVMNTRHYCVEGWSMVPKWGGTPLREFLRLVGADTNARFVGIECADEYATSYDMPSALHPQTLLCYEAYTKPLSISHGAPLRIVVPTKLGYKSAKWVQRIVVTNEKPGGYWEDQGYDWFAGV